ncbi:MAG: hypothetical protein A2Y34_04860 [Spirochaetes bacterium GWC1_27_15]|nr:MAG: hypothetical protein A2Z98_18620 [Spirochaetes bacterium GWB1_27_13]OHD20236.1 MAG: hypothetical protein A2Y34_04860 [Spirochaetes bacterium GWC1_27_15]
MKKNTKIRWDLLKFIIPVAILPIIVLIIIISIRIFSYLENQNFKLYSMIISQVKMNLDISYEQNSRTLANLFTIPEVVEGLNAPQYKNGSEEINISEKLIGSETQIGGIRKTMEEKIEGRLYLVELDRTSINNNTPYKIHFSGINQVPPNIDVLKQDILYKQIKNDNQIKTVFGLFKENVISGYEGKNPVMIAPYYKDPPVNPSDTFAKFIIVVFKSGYIEKYFENIDELKFGTLYVLDKFNNIISYNHPISDDYYNYDENKKIYILGKDSPNPNDELLNFNDYRMLITDKTILQKDYIKDLLYHFPEEIEKEIFENQIIKKINKNNQDLVDFFYSYNSSSNSFVLNKNTDMEKKDKLYDLFLSINFRHDININKTKINYITFDNKRYMTIVDGSDLSGVKFIYFHPQSQFLKPIIDIVFIISVITFIFLIIIIIISFSFSKTFTNPIELLVNATKKIAEGDYSYYIEQKSHNEIGVLTDNFNKMINEVKDYQEKLISTERKKQELELITQLQEVKFEENKKYLENIKEGLLLIDKNFKISNQYSNYLTHLFGKEEIAGKNFIDFIYPDNDKNKNEREYMTFFLNSLFTNINTEMEMLMLINPLKDQYIKINRSDTNEDFFVNINFQRIYNNNAIENVMVLFEDKTLVIKAEKELEKEKNRKDAEISAISAILKQGPQVFIDFINETNNVLSELNQNIDILKDDEARQHIFRHLHSLKGAAYALDLKQLAEITHIIEDQLSSYKDSQNIENIKEKINNLVDLLLKEIQIIDRLLDKFRLFCKLDIDEYNNSPKALLDKFLMTLKDMVDNISVKIDKEVEFKYYTTLFDFPYLNKIKNSIIHLIRNALDHGIEDKFEKLTINKTQKSLIKLEIYKDNTDYYIEVIDNGKGIDFEAIRRKAIQKSLISENDNITNLKLINFIFSPDFSSKDHVTDLSGRGVGLDVVKNEVEELSGKISVATKENVGTKFTIRLPIK